MICSKITRKVSNNTQNLKQQQLIIGMSDYIPQHLKMNKNLSICIIGNKSQIINHILWNEFFAKTLLKEAYHYLIQNSSKDDQNISAIFIKHIEKVYKLQEINDWNCTLRSQMNKSSTQPTFLQIQGFSSKGYIKKVSILISKYSINNNEFDVVLHTNPQQNIHPKKSKSFNDINSCSIKTQKVLEQNNSNLGKQYKISYNTAQKFNSYNNSRKNTQQQYHSSTTKRSINSKVSTVIDKQNSKAASSKLTKSKYKKPKFQQQLKQKVSTLNKQFNSKSTKSNNFFSTEQLSQKIAKISRKQEDSKVDASKTRQSVMSKIISSKQQQIVSLKQRFNKQQRQYEDLLYNQQKQHKLQVQQLTNNVKDLLNNYQKNQKEYLNENSYLKERLKVMEQSLTKNNDQLQKNTKDLQGQINRVRQHQQTISKLNQIIHKYRNQDEQTRNKFIQQNGRLMSQLKNSRQTADQYKYKYQKIMQGMKSMMIL